MKNSKISLSAPFLKRVFLEENAKFDDGKYPFTASFVQKKTLDITFSKPVTIIVGENGSGKSTLLEALATGSGFNLDGGNRNHLFGKERKSALAPFLRFSWLPKVNRGFFMRAESFFNFATYIDDIAREDATIHRFYGGTSLHEHSHGEAFLALFKNQFSGDGIYILDEPEAALSPSRQLVFLKILRELEKQNCQLIIATHSPFIMAYPGATVLKVEDGVFTEIDFKDTSHFLLTREFIKRPDSFIQELFDENERSGDKM